MRYDDAMRGGVRHGVGDAAGETAVGGGGGRHSSTDEAGAVGARKDRQVEEGRMWRRHRGSMESSVQQKQWQMRDTETITNGNETDAEKRRTASPDGPPKLQLFVL